MPNQFLNFNDRFGANGGVGSLSRTDALATEDKVLEQLSPALADIARIVRSYSVVLGRATKTVDIFQVITTQTDPRISLILAAAKRRSDNSPLFPGLAQVQTVMFGDSNPNINPNSALFSDGIRRITTALCASVLIGRLAQVTEQFEHAKKLEEEALGDLQKIVDTYDLRSGTTTNTTTGSDTLDNIALYFEPKDLVDPVVVRLFLPTNDGNSGWINVTADASHPNTPSGFNSSWEIVVAIADAINSITLNSISNSGLMAVPTLNATGSLHALSVYPRKLVIGLAAEIVNVEIYTTGQTTAPMRWGPDSAFLNTYPINGALVVLSGNKASTATSVSEDKTIRQPTVLYFRKSQTQLQINTNDLLRFRVLPLSEEIIEVPITRILSTDVIEQDALDRARYSQVAVALLNALVDIEFETKALGAIVRNDPIDSVTTPYCALELIPWSASNREVYIVLDILQVPADIELATGDLLKPITQFSRLPRSVRVESRYESSFKSGNNPNSSDDNGPQLVYKPKTLSDYQKICEETELVVAPKFLRKFKYGKISSYRPPDNPFSY